MEMFQSSKIMFPHRHPLKFKLIFVLLAVLLIILGLAAFSVLGFWVSNTAVGEKNERNPVISTQALALLRSERLTTPTPLADPILTPTTTPAQQGLPVIVPQNQRGLLTNGKRDEYKIALTFDLCETEGDLAGYDSQIIQILNKTQTPATLFLGGLWMRDHQAETLELAGNPLFELGNHSWSHADFSAISRVEMDQQIILTQQTMHDLLGYQTNLFRLPYGTYSDDALNAINDQGLYIIQWDDVSGDPDPDIGAKEMTAWVLQQAQPGSIIIMHANGRGWHTAEALPRIIQSLRDQGYTLVTISKLLNIQPYK
jgi:peptidoglycan-N-acetylglucosamine deacetylase